jgi:hypothetical protein
MSNNDVVLCHDLIMMHSCSYSRWSIKWWEVVIQIELNCSWTTRWNISLVVSFLGSIMASNGVLYKNEGESVNRSQMGIKRKTCDIRTLKKHLFLNISSTNIDTLVPSLYQCIKTCSTEVFWLLSQPLLHLRFNPFIISKTSATKVIFLEDQTEGSH